MALNLSKKMKNFPHSHSTSSLFATQNPQATNDADSSPIDLSKSTQKATPETFRSDIRKEKKKKFANKEEQQKEINRLQSELKEEESNLMLLRLIKRSQQIFNYTPKITSNLPSVSKSLNAKNSCSSSIYSNGSDFLNKNYENNHINEKVLNSNSTSIQPTNQKNLQKQSSLPNFNSNNDKVNNFHNSHSNSSKSSSPSFANFYNGLSNFMNSNFGHSSSNGSVEAFLGSGGLYPGLNRSPQSSRNTPNSLQSEAQWQQAARLAHRKQLEKSLMQIPLPKPLIPELNFVPNANSAEFIALLGLEEVVKNLVDGEARRRGELTSSDVKYIFKPFKCVQCASDFTPVWKRDKPGSKNVICERCVTSNQKRAVKNEHTSKLKSVFSKAALKEQELNKNILRPPSPSTSSKSPSFNSLLNNSPQVPPIPPSPLPLSSLSSLSNFFNPSSISKNFFAPESLYNLSPTDFSSMASLFSMPPSFWPHQNFPFPLNPNTAQALTQQLMFPFSASFPSKSASLPISSSSSSLLAAQRQFLMDFMPPRRPQQDGSPLLWRS